MMTIPINYFVVLAGLLFAIGAGGVLLRRSGISILLGIELMLNAVNLTLVAFSRQHGQLDGQVFVFFVMAVAAAEVAVGLALLVAIFRKQQSIDVDRLNVMRW
jgi:NADH-quinone oxidoreductase subunit K